MIVLTNRDINNRDFDTRFMFAQTAYVDRVTVISGNRLSRGTLKAYASEDKIRARMMKFALRSIGELHFYLPRADDPESALFKSVRSVADVDRMGFVLGTNPEKS